MSDQLNSKACEGPGCKVVFDLPPDAPHKRFHSTHCRNAWHSARQKAGLALLEAVAEQAEEEHALDNAEPIPGSFDEGMTKTAEELAGEAREEEKEDGKGN